MSNRVLYVGVLLALFQGHVPVIGVTATKEKAFCHDICSRRGCRCKEIKQICKKCKLEDKQSKQCFHKNMMPTVDCLNKKAVQKASKKARAVGATVGLAGVIIGSSVGLVIPVKIMQDAVNNLKDKARHYCGDKPPDEGLQGKFCKIYAESAKRFLIYN